MIDVRGRRRRPRPSHFRVGQLVRVRSAAEIQATLDENGLLDGLPFMPEMTQFCGSTVRVRRSAHKTCASHGALRSMERAVFLDGVHCDGSAHGGCQSRCPAFWKDAWLAPAGNGEAPAAERAADERLERKAARSVRLHGRDAGAGTYSCQSTELLDATVRLPSWSLRQYWDDVRSGNLTLGSLVRGLPVILFNKFQLLSTRVLPPRLRIRGGRRYPNIVGRLVTTPDVRLGIEAGEMVEIRSHEEILGTLDAESRNRGLGFDFDMVPYCGRRSKVLHRVERIIDEGTGELVEIRNPCLVLDGVVCRGRYHRFCPRAVDIYWREAWLRRVDPHPADDRPPRDETLERRPASTVTSA